MTIRLLGAPRVERDGVSVEVDTRKAIALLAYLAVTGQPQPREALAALLWPESDEARSALRRTLSTLNQALAGLGLEIGRDVVGLRRGPDVWIDLDEFERAVGRCKQHGHSSSEVCPDCLDALTTAATLYRDDFLAGFSLRDSPPFDEWRFFQVERLRRELAGVLQRLARVHATNRVYELALAAARRWLALDPLHEPAHRALMRLYARSGQRSAALRQYRECVRILDHELGVAPLDETTRLYEAIKEDRRSERDSSGLDRASIAPDPAPAPVAIAPPATSRPTDYPLVGRGAEWQTLLGAYESCRDGGRLAVLEGEAGIGKTRLAEALVEHARAAGAKVLAARCFAGEGDLAFGPFLDGLRAALGAPDQSWLAAAPAHAVAEAARLRPELADLRRDLPPAPPLDSPGSQGRFFEGVCLVLFAATAGTVPGVIFIDDLQWADPSSLDLLAYLVRRLRDQPRCILVTWRPEDVPAPGAPRLRQLLAEADRAGRATEIRLRRLDAGAIRELVAGLGLAAAARPAEFVERLYRETEGVPYFVVAYLAALGRDAATRDLEWSLPRSAQDLLRARLDGLGNAAGQLLGAAAVIGRSFDFEVLRAASGRSDEETVAALEELLVRDLVIEVADGSREAASPAGPALRYDFSHEKLRSLVYDETSLARRRLLHRRVAEALAARLRAHRGDSELGTIARHYQLAGQEAAAADYYAQAGERARSLYANSEALAHFRSALALGHPQAATLHEAIGDLLTLLGEYGAAIRSYETAAARSEPAALASLEHKLGTVYHRRGEWEQAESHFATALARLEAPPGRPDTTGARARVYADWSLTAHRQGGADRAHDLAARALDLAEAAGDRRALAQAHNLLGILATSGGELAAARHHLAESLALAEESGDPGARVAARNNLALADAASGDRERAILLAEEALAICQAQGDRHREAALHNNLADLLQASGQSEAALAHLKQAVTIYADIGVEAGTLQPEVWKLTEW